MDVAMIRADQVLTHVKLSGRMDVEGIQRNGLEFTEQVAGAGVNAVVDMSLVTFMSSIGMRLVLDSSRKLNSKGARLVLLGPRGMVAESLRIARVGDIIPIVEDLGEALALLAP